MKLLRSLPIASIRQRDNDVSSDQSNTLIFCIPIEVLDAFRAGNGGAKVVQKIVDMTKHPVEEDK